MVLCLINKVSNILIVVMLSGYSVLSREKDIYNT